MRKRFSALLALVALLVAPCAWADYFIVVNDANPVREMSQQEVLHLFMGRARQFPDGAAAVACDLSGAALRDGFYRALSGMSPAQVTSYWARLMFSGRSLPPQRLEDEAAMIEKVSRDTRAIGWLSNPPAQKGLRTVLVLKTVP